MKQRRMRVTALFLSFLMAAEIILPVHAYAEPTERIAVVEEENYDTSDGLEFTDLIGALQTSSLNGEEYPSLGGREIGRITPGIPEAEEALVGADIPSSYRAVDRSDVTRIKDQMNYGTCWTFASLASGEQTLIKNSTPLNGEPDLAEIQLAWFSYMDEGASQYGDTQGDKSFVSFSEDGLSDQQKAYKIYDMGGWREAAIWTLARGIGAADEKVTPQLNYERNYGTFDKAAAVDRSFAYLSEATLQNALEVNMKENPMLAKQMIMEYGALATGYLCDWNSYSVDKKAFYYDGVSEIHPNAGNHIVAVVGWDDDYAIENFKEDRQPQHPGAWLIKNSWGVEQGDHGYFWLSYDNYQIFDAYAFDMVKTEPGVRDYQYDGTSGINESTLPNNSRISNVFTAAGTEETGKKEVIDHVSFGVATANLDYEIQIYKNPSDSSVPESGTPMLAQSLSGHLLNPGYHTINLPQKLIVEKDDQFAVVVGLSEKNNKEVRIWTDATYQMDMGGLFVNHVDSMQQGQSFLLQPDTEWMDLSEQKGDDSFTPRIKAFTKVVDYVPETSVSLNKTLLLLDAGQSETLQAVVAPENSTPNGVLWKSSNPFVASVTQDGTVVGKNTGCTEITAETYSGLTVSCEVRVQKDITSIEAIAAKKTAEVNTVVDKSTIKTYACSSTGRVELLPEQFSISQEKIAEGANTILVTYKTDVYNLTTTLNIKGVKAGETGEVNLAPRMLQSSVVVNRSQKKQGSFFMIPAAGTENQVSADSVFYQNVNLEKAVEGLKLTQLSDKEYQVTADASYPTGKKKLYVKASVEANQKTETYAVPITVQVVNKTPSISVKVGSMNVFYTDTASRTRILKITNPSGVKISSIQPDEQLNRFFEIKKRSSGQYSLVYKQNDAVNSAKDIVKKGVIHVMFEGYQNPVAVKLNIPVTMKAPSVKSLDKTAVLNLYQNSNYNKSVYITDQKGNIQEMKSAKFADDSLSENFAQISVVDGYISMELKPSAKDLYKKAKTVKLLVTGEDWKYSCPVSFKFQVSEKKPSAKLSTKKLKLNQNYMGSSDSVKLDFNTDLGEAGYILNDSCIKLTSKNSAGAPKISIEQWSDTMVDIEASVFDTTQSGTYKYQITPKLAASGEELDSQNLTVKVVKSPISIALSRIKGSNLNVLMGDQAEVSYAAGCKNFSATIDKVAVEGTDSDFEASLSYDEKDKCIVTVGLKEGKTVQAGESYLVPIRISTIDDNRNEYQFTTELKLKAQEGKLKYDLSVKNAILSKGASECYVESKAAVVSPESTNFTSLRDVSKNIPEDAFYVYASPYTGRIRITLRDESKVKTGKTYTFTFAAKAGTGTSEVKQNIKIRIEE